MNSRMVILIILIAYMLCNMVVGIVASIRSSKANASKGFLKNYFIGSRTMGGVVLAMTLVATYTSASSFLGGPGLAASTGLTQSWIAAVQIGTTFLTLGVLGKKLGIISRKIGAVTVTDYLKERYQSSFVVILCSVLLVVFFITQMVAQFIGGATLIQTVTGLPYWAGLLLFGTIVIIYTTVGGFKAVVMTDTIQGFIMSIGTFLLIFFVIKAGGGLTNIASTLDVTNPGWDLFGKGTYGANTVSLSPGFLISYWILVGLAVMGLPQTAVRGMGFKDTKALHRAMIVGTVVVGILMIGMHWAGAMCGPLVQNADIKSTDAVIPYVVLNYMPSWAAGLFLAAPLAAVMSTVDSLLILASATIIKDVVSMYKPKHKQKSVSKVSFLLTLGIGVIVFLIALSPPDIIVWINLFALGGLECTFFWPLVGGLYWKKGNATSCKWSIIIGIVVFVFFNRVKIAPFHIHEVVWGLLAGGIAYFVAGALSKKEPDPEMIKKCF